MIFWNHIPCVTAEEMSLIDSVTIDEYHLPLGSMMENAGKSLALVAHKILGTVKNKTIFYLIGKGHNGGGGLVSARHLSNWGAHNHLVLASDISELKPTTYAQFNILAKSRMDYSHAIPDNSPDLIIDALLGYRGKGDPREPLASYIQFANEIGAPKIALDIPSGLDPDTGKPNIPCISAVATVTLALPKIGLLRESASNYVGRLYLADIGIPNAIYRQVLSTNLTIFENGPLIDLSRTVI